MAQEAGKNWKFHLNTGTTLSPSWTLIGNQKDGSVSFKQNMIDTTTKSDAGWTSNTATTKDMASSFSIIYDKTDQTHAALMAAALNQTLKHFKLIGASGENWIYFAYVSLECAVPVDNMAEVSVTLERNGAPTYSAS
jgi:hypothetical protein